MKTVLKLHLFSICVLLTLSTVIFAQTGDYVGTKIITRSGETKIQTIPMKNLSTPESLDKQLLGWRGNVTENPRILGGNLLWSFQDPVAIARRQVINGSGQSPMTAWGLNNERISLYSDANNTPLWEFITDPNDGYVAISQDGNIIAASKGSSFYLLDPATGNSTYQIDLPDSLGASHVKISRDGSFVIFLARPKNGSSTSQVYAIDLTGTPSILWTMNFTEPYWIGVNISADGSRIAVNARYHMYILNTTDGSLIWDHFIDNTESPVAISGDGQIIVSADNSGGFIITRIFDPVSNEYQLLWQYHVPAGYYKSWARAPAISADGKVIMAGTLLFPSNNTNNGSILAFDTFSGNTPRWIYGNTGDMVTDIALSDDGSVAAATTWGDMDNTLPDLLVFDVATGNMTYGQVTPGSLFSVDITPDGKRVYAGGKAVHARVYGNGGLIYLVDIDLGGGSISGNVNLTNTSDNSGVTVDVLGTQRSTVTNTDGSYQLNNLPEGTYNIRAHKPGYNFGDASGITVIEGDTTSGIDFAMDPFTTVPPNLTASQWMMNAILLSWSSGQMKSLSKYEINMIIGDVDDLTLPMSIQTKSVIGTSRKNILQTPSMAEDNQTMVTDSIAIYRGLIAGGPYNLITSVPISESSYIDSSVFPFSDYFYVITVFNDVGESIYSNEAMGQVNDSLFTFDFDTPQQTVTPSIDGIISAGEWDDAVKIDVSDVLGYSGEPKPAGSAFLYFKFDADSELLYIAGEDFLNTSLDNNEGFGFYFDDNHDGVFDSVYNYIEGNFWAYWHPSGSNLRFRKLPEYTTITLSDAEVEFSDVSGHLQGEVVIPMGFSEGYQLQVYGPDKIVGLGAFIIERDNNNAVFNGWWPQNMNFIRNPLYFGNVGIDVSLSAPPNPPTDVTVTRQDNSLLINWSDPTDGVNNIPLPVQPVIHLFRNGELYADISAGVESFTDNSVICGGWYEYHLQASITLDTLELFSPNSESIGIFACQDPPLTPISYDDGTWEAFYVVSYTYDDNKFAVRFTPTFYPTQLIRVEALAINDAPFDFTIQADSSGYPGDILAGPYRVHADVPSVGTVTLTLPGGDPPLFEEGDFWVVLNYLPESPDAPAFGVDKSSPNENRGMYYTAAGGWKDLTVGNLMVTSYITSQILDVEDQNGAGSPKTFSLDQNYPNPFNPETIIRYEIPKSTFVTLNVYNITGQLVATLVNEQQNTGRYSVTWNGSNVSSGVYIYRLIAGNYVSVKKAILLK